MENLPRYFALELLSNNKYLRYIDDEDVALHGHLEFSGEDVISLYTKYEMEPAKNKDNTGSFNIRCCYNNRYWTRRDDNTSWINATAPEPVEDLSKWSCTLFQPSIQVSEDGKSTMLTLRHFQYGASVVVSVGSDDPTYQWCLKAEPNPPELCHEEDSNNTTAFSIIDWESFVILPKLVEFKGDNDLYLRLVDDYLSFASSNIVLPNLSNQVLYTPVGSVYLRTAINGDNNPYNYRWYHDSHGQIVAYDLSNKPGGDLFWIVKGHGDNEVAIRCIAAKSFCHRSTQAVDLDIIRVGAYKMLNEAIMRVEEPVVSRSVYNVDFCLERARIYDQCDVIMVSKQINNPLNSNQSFQLIEKFTKETTRTWNSSITIKLATPTKIKTSIPLIVDGEVGFSDEFEGRYEWGTDMTGSQTIEFFENIVIPTSSTLMVHVIATKAKCDVPCFYMQRDTLTDGTVVINKKDDGVFTGINYYNFKTKVAVIS